MKTTIGFSRGTNVRDFFVIPTIRICRHDDARTFVTIEWLKWYVGVVF